MSSLIPDGKNVDKNSSCVTKDSWTCVWRLPGLPCSILTLRKTPDVKTVRIECSNITLSLWFLIFFLSLICQICIIEGVFVGGGGGKFFLKV